MEHNTVKPELSAGHLSLAAAHAVRWAQNTENARLAQLMMLQRAALADEDDAPVYYKRVNQPLSLPKQAAASSSSVAQTSAAASGPNLLPRSTPTILLTPLMLPSKNTAPTPHAVNELSSSDSGIDEKQSSLSLPKR